MLGFTKDSFEERKKKKTHYKPVKMYVQALIIFVTDK